MWDYKVETSQNQTKAEKQNKTESLTHSTVLLLFGGS